MIQPFSCWWPITVASTESAMSSTRQTPRPAITRSKNTNTPARTSVTPFSSLGEVRGRRRADADHRAGEAGGAQRARAACTAAARSLLGHRADRLGRTRSCRSSPAWVMTPCTGRRRLRRSRADLRAVAGRRAARRSGGRRESISMQHVEMRAAPRARAAASMPRRPRRCRASASSRTPCVLQREHVVELVRRDADGVEDVADAVRREVLGLAQGRDRDRPAAASP